MGKTAEGGADFTACLYLFVHLIGLEALGYQGLNLLPLGMWIDVINSQDDVLNNGMQILLPVSLLLGFLQESLG